MGFFDGIRRGYEKAERERMEKERAEEEARIAKAQDDERRSRLTPEDLAAEDRQRAREEDERRRWNSFMSDRAYKDGVVTANFATDNIDFFFRYHSPQAYRMWQAAADAGRMIQELNRNNDYAQTVLNNRLANIEDKIDKQGEVLASHSDKLDRLLDQSERVIKTAEMINDKLDNQEQLILQLVEENKKLREIIKERL